MSFLTTMDANEIYYSDLGRGDPVVLIHGWPLNADMWEYQMTPLAERGHRVVAFDRRGHG
ncbi:MAG: alpha/beta fold hydrolase, partial [Bdellovibrionota bacterium]